MLAFYSKIANRKLEKKYDHPLSDMVDASTALENYVKIYRSVGIRVHEEIPFPALASEEFVIINRDRIYSTDLYTNFFTIFQLELSKKVNNFSRKLHLYQNLLFFLQLLFFVLGLTLQVEWNYILILLAIGTQVITTGFSLIGVSLFDFILKDSLEISKDLLNLDEVEVARAEGLKNDIKVHVFEYPIEFFKNVIGFFIP